MPNLSIQKYLSNKIVWVYIISGGFVLCTALLGLFISSVQVPVPTILHIIWSHVSGLPLMEEIPKNIDKIIWEIRLPRILLAALVGMSLALAGATFQGLLRNPLADPYTIGVSSGAALGAVVVLFFQIQVLGMFTLPLFAIVGGFFSLFIVFGMTRVANRSHSMETLILAGIIVSSFIGSFITLIIALSGEELRQILFWLMGSVAMRGWSHVYLLLPFWLLGTGIILFHYRELNALSLGDTSAQYIGVQVRKKKRMLLLGASLLTGAAVAVSGTIGFVGLVVPHLVRLLTGPNHKHVLPLSMLVGASFLMASDLLSRTIIAPTELPIGVITALLGAPFFAMLLIRERNGKGLN